MTRVPSLFCAPTMWRQRAAYELTNDFVRIITLAGGGHIADFSFRDRTGFPSLNPLWTPPWKTIDPYRYRAKLHAREYGPQRDGHLLCGLAGHNLCLDYFGPPSDEEARMGLSFHGEAPNLKWRKENRRVEGGRAELTVFVRLPIAGLDFRRNIEIRLNEPVAYFTETVENRKPADHFFQWAEHVTVGPPFLSAQGSYVVIPATKGMSDPGGYDEGRALLAPGRCFRWPTGPTVSGGSVDLARPLARKGLGFVSTLLLDPRRELGFVAAVNTRLRLLIGYCFARRDFPWVALWDENCAIQAPPWKQRTQARGLEFSTTPFPSGRRDAFSRGSLFGVPTLTYLPARQSKTVHYAAFLAHLPEDFGQVRDILAFPGTIEVRGSGRRKLCLSAAGWGANGRSGSATGPGPGQLDLISMERWRAIRHG